MKPNHYQMYVKIGLNILYYRKERGLTQLELAEMTDKSRNQIQRVETAYSAPSLAILMDIAEALDIPLTKLLDLKE